MAEWQSFVLQLRRTATAATTFVISTRAFEPGLTLHIDAIGVTNLDSAGKLVDVGVRRAGVDFYFETLTITTATYYYSTTRPFTIPSDYKIIVRALSPASGDRYIVNIFGRFVEKMGKEAYLGE